jgi:predicted CopG family antitoxin
MAVKTITIDIESYTLLSRLKREGESFSQVIKAHFKPQPTAARFLERVRAIRMNRATLDVMDQRVKARGREPSRAVRK